MKIEEAIKIVVEMAEKKTAIYYGDPRITQDASVADEYMRQCLAMSMVKMLQGALRDQE